MAFTVKYLQRLNVDELKELLSDDEAELTDSERERITGVIGEKEKPPEPDPQPDPKPDPNPDASGDDDGDDDDPPWLEKVIDGVSEKVIGSLTTAEAIVDSVTNDEPDPDPDPEPDPDPDPKPNGDKPDDEPPARKRSLADRFHGG